MNIPLRQSAAASVFPTAVFSTGYSVLSALTAAVDDSMYSIHVYQSCLRM